VEELGLKETVIFVGILSSRYRYKFRNSCVCLTNKNLRWYRSSRILDEESTWDFVPGLIGTVPLLGSSIQDYTDDAGQTYLVIFDTRGNKYYIRSVNDTDLKNWYDEISKVIRKLVQDFILEGHTLSINFEAQSQEEDVPEGSGILNINKKKVEFRFLYSQDVVSVRLENIREVSADDDLVFKLRYVEKDDEEKTLSFKSDTSFALSYTFIHLRYCEQLQKNFKKKGKTIAWEQEDPFSHHVSTYRTEDRTEDDRDIEDDKNRDDEDDEEHDEEEPTEKPKSTNDNIALDDFILLKVVGRGAFGKVLLCKFKVDNKIYAMKAILKKSLVKNKKRNRTYNDRVKRDDKT